MFRNASRYAVEGGIVVSHADPRMPWAVRVARDLMALLLPALAVVVTLFFAWQLRSMPFTYFDGILSPPHHPELYPSQWLSVGHAVVPAIFLIANLVNRRLGEDYAIAHIFLSWSAVLIATLAVLFEVHPLMPQAGVTPPLRTAAAFLGALVVGQLVGAYVFDRTRGVEWWKAPLYSALASSLVAVFIFYPSAYAGINEVWLHRMSIDAGVKVAMSFALLLPYLLLRPIVRPSAGLGGF